jgi:hypothetical protein
MLGWLSFLRMAISLTTSSVRKRGAASGACGSSAAAASCCCAASRLAGGPPQKCAVALLSVEEELEEEMLPCQWRLPQAPSAEALVGEWPCGAPKPERPELLLLPKAARRKQRCCGRPALLLANCDLRQALTAYSLWSLRL